LIVALPAAGDVCCPEEDEELRKALELSLKDIGKFESSVGRNLNPDAAASAGGVSENSAGDNDASLDRYMGLGSTASEDDLLSGNVFGVIKDIRVSNIVATDNDKMSDFDAKNFKQLLSNTDPVAALLTGGTGNAWTGPRDVTLHFSGGEEGEARCSFTMSKLNKLKVKR